MRSIFFIILLLASTYIYAERPRIEAKDSLLIEEMLKLKAERQPCTSGEVMALLGKKLLETPYKGGSLEENDEESLLVNLHAFDCTTFVESVAALTICDGKGSPLSAFTEILQRMRYRDGEIAGYASRLHYFSEWIVENEKHGVVKEVTQLHKESIQQTKNINFMSAHPQYYTQLANNDSAIAVIKEVEQRLSATAVWYIPKEQLSNEQLAWVESGDIVAITTPIEGLDMVHVGIAIRQGEEVHLLHASSDAKRVILDSRTLSEQLAGNKNQSGIRVVRLTNSSPKK